MGWDEDHCSEKSIVDSAGARFYLCDLMCKRKWVCTDTAGSHWHSPVIFSLTETEIETEIIDLQLTETEIETEIILKNETKLKLELILILKLKYTSYYSRQIVVIHNYMWHLNLRICI